MKAIFAGKTKEGANATLYRNGDVFSIKVDDAEPLTLTTPGFTPMVDTINDRIDLMIESPEWTGTIAANRFELVVEEGFTL